MMGEVITAVGIDVSKGKSVVAARKPGGEVILPPTQVNHTAEELAHLVDRLRKIGGDIRIVMEHNPRFTSAGVISYCLTMRNLIDRGPPSLAVRSRARSDNSTTAFLSWGHPLHPQKTGWCKYIAPSLV